MLPAQYPLQSLLLIHLLWAKKFIYGLVAQLLDFFFCHGVLPPSYTMIIALETLRNMKSLILPAVVNI